MLIFIGKITVLCFAASYGVAFALEIWHLLRPRPIWRLLALGFGAAGLFAHISYLASQAVPLGSPTGALLLLALVLAAFYVGEAIHHGRIPWALFVLPIVLILIGLATVVEWPMETAATGWQWLLGITHGALLLLAAVGVSIGFIASVMYLLQLRRLQAKAPPGQGMPLLSLERLELMNRRAVLWSFPLLTMGLAAGLILQIHSGLFEQWLSPRILGVVGLWLVFAILLYLRHRVHVRGRQLAWLTMVAFAILVVALVFPHSFDQGGGP